MNVKLTDPVTGISVDIDFGGVDLLHSTAESLTSRYLLQAVTILQNKVREMPRQ